MSNLLRNRKQPGEEKAETNTSGQEEQDDCKPQFEENPAVAKRVEKYETASGLREPKPWPLDYILMTVTVIVCMGSLMYIIKTGDKGVRLFDRSLLAKYNGDLNAPLYLAVLGEVFDVSQNPRHYDKDGGYHHFVGRDATRAFVTGDFTNDLTDRVRDFTPEQCKTLVNWRNFYRKDYVFKGRVKGNFIDADGNPRPALMFVEESAAKAEAAEEAARKEAERHPDCSMHWTDTTGTELWCENGALYPRKVFHHPAGATQPTTRCGCFEEMGWSDMRQLYPGCSPEAKRCRVNN